MTICKYGAGVAVALLALAGAPPCRAAFAVYTNQAAFNAATTNGHTFNFDNLAPQDSYTFYESLVTTNGVLFSTTNAGLYAIGRDYAGAGAGTFVFDSANVVVQDNAQPSNLTAVLPLGTTAFAVDVGMQDPTTSLLTTVTLSTGESFTLDVAARPGLSFVGFTADTGIASVTYSSAGFGLSFADATTAQAVPEPAGVVLLGGAAASLLTCGWRRRKAPKGRRGRRSAKNDALPFSPGPRRA
jgi:hypothetical protein